MAFLKEELKKKDAVIMDEMKKEIDKAEKEDQQEAQVVEQETLTADEVTTEVNSEIETLKAELEQKQKDVLEHADRVKRLQADFDNFRRRTRQEKEELSTFVVQGLIKDLLPLLDNLERAISVESADETSLREGVSMIYKQFFAALEKNGLESIKAVGEKFDPNFHQAIMRVEDADKEDDIVAEELQKGYSVHGRVIRPSMVKVVAN
ncbi:nucleotide exchange factor GrpE [Propionispira raffinosivorans]|uniref:nucleotide exchange factor GrpE n=1 Tax=Propionispira raffinosivorans TaxID=86959 RepID=UPI0003683541|nr:nucleotide exchange factor GrpE [Propionispira raffinosivorans]